MPHTADVSHYNNRRNEYIEKAINTSHTMNLLQQNKNKKEI